MISTVQNPKSGDSASGIRQNTYSVASYISATTVNWLVIVTKKVLCKFHDWQTFTTVNGSSLLRIKLYGLFEQTLLFQANEMNREETTTTK